MQKNQTFDSLGLSAELLKAVAESGYTTPTPIQCQAIPAILEGRDVMANAQTGTGKTAGFTLPLLQLLHTSKVASVKGGARPVRALILAPTRELAAQVGENVRAYGKHLPLKSTIIFGGVSIVPQTEHLRRGVDIVIATPGRLLDHVQQRSINLSQVEFLILDEADRMLDMGFIRDIRKVLALVPQNRQNLLFSATFSEEIKALAKGFLRDPVTVQAQSINTAAPLVSQLVYPVDAKRKKDLLQFLIKSQKWEQVLVFTRTKHGANRLAEQLQKADISAAAIHGNKSQGARTRALAEFKSRTIRVLVATDIAARGLDIDLLPHVVNFELPHVPEDYVHRIGRTGRAGSTGLAVSLVCVDELHLLRDIEKLLKGPIPREQVPGFEPDPSIKAEAIPNGQNRGSRPSRGGSGHRTNGPRPGQRSGQQRKRR